MIKKEFEGKQVTRRSLLGGVITLGGGVAVSATVSQTDQAPPSVIVRNKAYALVASAAQNRVEIDSGKLYGYSRGGVTGFRGIPYAADTEGAARFLPPQRARPWAGVRSALYWGASSPTMQNCTIQGRRANWGHDDEAFMFEWDDGQPSEDCLRLNVWTPGLDHQKRAVMFWIHGGGMTTGSANELRAYDGENLARQEDVVVVSINHRLGVLGFLNLRNYGDQYADSANLSMLDIVAALQWVKTNIGRFGGDPSRVMIFGQSGGGGKVGTLMGMPAAKGLFHRASIQSGSSMHEVTPENSEKLADATLAELGIHRGNIDKLHSDFSYAQLVQAGLVGQQKASAGEVLRLPGDRGAGWGPTLDGRVIPRHIWEPTAPEASADVPLIVGSVLNEQGNSVQMGDAALEKIDMADAKRRLPRILVPRADKLFQIAQELHPSATPFELYSRSSAMINRALAYSQIKLKADQGRAPAYLYWFQWQSPICDGRARSFHTVELPFCFHNAELCAKITGDSPEAHDLAGRMAGAWSAFAKTGDPNHSGIPTWQPFNEHVPTLIFDTKCDSVANPEAEFLNEVLEAIAS